MQGQEWGRGNGGELKDAGPPSGFSLERLLLPPVSSPLATRWLRLRLGWNPQKCAWGTGICSICRSPQRFCGSAVGSWSYWCTQRARRRCSGCRGHAAPAHTLLCRIVLVSVLPFKSSKMKASGGNGWNPFSLLFLPARGVAGASRKFLVGRTPKGGH